MKAVVSIANVASRVGKTTTAVNLATELARRGLRTLLVDAAPQAQATAYFIDPEQLGFSLADVLITSENGQPLPSLSLSDVIVPADLPDLHLVPGSIRLAAFESEMPFHLQLLKAKLDALDETYDFIIIDTPSSLGPISSLCMYASTHVLIPVAPHTQSREGLRLIAGRLGDMPCVHPPGIIGIVCNLFDCRDRSSGLFHEELKDEWGGQVFEMIIHRNDLVKGCAKQHQLAQIFDQHSVWATLYAQLADKVLTKLENVCDGRVTLTNRMA